MPISPRLFFVLAIVFQGFIWSQSRYQPTHHVQGLSGTSLWRRSSLEPDLHHQQCIPIGQPVEAQCTHIQDQCSLHPTFLSIDYLTAYFCTAPNLRPLVFVGLLTWLIFLFSTLGISASDFFTPNLATLSQLLGLDENVAGVTFLAFGNGSPDLFSTFSAMKAGSGGLAIGELLGAASFIVSCVVGSMCIIKPFKVERGPFLRDVGFFTAAMVLVLVILWDGTLHLWEAGMLIAMYFFYVTFVVVGSWWEKRRQRKRLEERLIRSEYAEDHMPPEFRGEEPYRDHPSPPPQSRQQLLPPSPDPPRVRSTSTPPLPRLSMPSHSPTQDLSRSSSTLNTSIPHYPQMPSFSLVGALEFRQVVASLQNESSISSLSIFDSPVTPYAGGHYHTHSHARTRSLREVSTGDPSNEIDPWDRSLGSLRLDERSPRSAHPHSHTFADDDSVNGQNHLAISTASLTPIPPTPGRRSPTPSWYPSDAESQATPRRGKRQRVISVLKEVYHILLPSLHGFREKTWMGKVAGVFAAPAIMALTLTLPVVVTPYSSGSRSPEKPMGGVGASIVLSGPEGDIGPPLVDFEEEGVERALIAEDVAEMDVHGGEMGFNKWLMAVQCTAGPLWCVGVLFSHTRHLKLLLLIAGLVGLSAGTLVCLFADPNPVKHNRVANMARCSMGFFVAIVWIMAIADEVVNVLQTFGFIFGLSDAIIGLTIFAVGNSLADFVANMSVAVFAPIMGFSACFGGPMLNILLGIGISGTYIITNGAAPGSPSSGHPYTLEFSSTLIVSTIGVMVLLISTLVFVPMNGYYLSRRWGWTLIAGYVVIMGVNLFVELRGE